MSQNDFTIANQTASAARADINSALQALASTSSGGTAPATPFANQLWLDTTGNILKIRNKTNTDWINIGTVDPTTLKFEPNVSIATQAEAEAGLENTKQMTSLRVAQAIDAQTAAHNYEAFTINGTWTKPVGISADTPVIIECWGGGGGGVRDATAANARGGGGGAYSCRFMRMGDLGATETVTVGVGGVGGSGTAPTVGGNTTFGVHVTAYGGGPGAAQATPLVGGGGSHAAGTSTVGGFIGGGKGDNALTIWGGGGCGGAAVHGGAGGGAGDNSLGRGSIYGGNGGNGSTSAPTAGAARGGGGGGLGAAAGTAGAGGRGEVRVRY